MQKTMNIDGQKITVRVRRRHSRGNPIGWTAKIGKATYYFSVLDPREAMDKAVAKYRAAMAVGDDHDGSGTGEGDRARAQHEKDKLGPGPRCWNCGGKITHEQAERNAALCDGCKAAQPQAGIADRVARHPMYSPSDLAYFRRKGYGDEEILAFWDRDHAMGCKPCHHATPPDVVGMLAGLPDHGADVQAAIERIAREHLGIETLTERKRDALDFHEMSVWQIKAALHAAFELGRRAAGQKISE